jgi:hypothetical protein
MDSNIDSFSFPPGLIPHLASLQSNPHHQQLQGHTTTAPHPSSSYLPLSIDALKIARIHPPPPPDQRDPYLEARLNKFYVHLDTYKPGMQYYDVQNSSSHSGINNNNNPANNNSMAAAMSPAGEATTTRYEGYKPPSSLNDGRYKGRRGKVPQSAGLGYGTSSSSAHQDGSGNQDPYDAYRAMRKAMTYKD